MPVDFADMPIEVLKQLKVDIDNIISQDPLEMDREDGNIMRQAVTFKSCPEETHVVVVAIHKRNNTLMQIKCKGGTQISGYTYDTVNDSCCVEGVDHFYLGYIPISFKIIVGMWWAYIPMPESVLIKYLTEKQRENLDSYKSHLGSDYTFDYLQMLG